MDRIRALELFARVCERGSFSEVARELGLAQSLISRHVAWLEEELGVTLLHRTTRKVSPTEAGARYLTRAQRVLAELAQARDELRDSADDPVGPIRFTAPNCLGRRVVLPSLLGFLARYPRVVLEARLRDDYFDMITERVDLAIRVGRLPDSSLVARRLGISTLVGVAAPVFAAKYPVQHPGDLARTPGIFVRSGSTLHKKPNLAAAPSTSSDHPRLVVDDLEAARDAAVAGVGVTFLPTWLVRDDLSAGRLVRVLCEVPIEAPPIYLVHVPEAALPARIRLLFDYLVAALEPALAA